MEIRYLDLGSVSPEIYTSLWEYDNVVELKEPTLIKFSTNQTLIQFWQGPYWDENTQTWKILAEPSPPPTIGGKGFLVHEYASHIEAKIVFSNYQTAWNKFNKNKI